MDVKVVIDGTAYGFESYLELRMLLAENATVEFETNEDNGVYFP